MRSRLLRAGTAVAMLGLLAVVLVGLATGGGSNGDRAYELEQRLRCPVCKSVSIAESLSDTALAMRATVDEQIAVGRSDEQIIDYFRGRYGDAVLLDPPLRGSTMALWILPLAAAAAGLAVVVTRHRGRPAGVEELDDEDRDRVAAALGRMRAADMLDDQP